MSDGWWNNPSNIVTTPTGLPVQFDGPIPLGSLSAADKTFLVATAQCMGFDPRMALDGDAGDVSAMTNIGFSGQSYDYSGKLPYSTCPFHYIHSDYVAKFALLTPHVAPAIVALVQQYADGNPGHQVFWNSIKPA